MKTRTLILLAVFCVAAISSSLASDPNLGTWKLNEAKSKIPPGVGKNITVVYTAAGDGYKCVVDGVDANGKPTRNEWTGKFDGKDYAVTGDPMFDSRSVRKVAENRYDLTHKKDGKVIATSTITFDGNTRTVSVNRTDASGKNISYTYVYDRQ